MISSTSQDLVQHRDQARDACLSQGLFPIMMEHLPASDEDAIAVSLQMVAEADVYLGIVGERYGFVPEGSAVSMTEMEYDKAVELGIPRLVFVMAAEHPIVGGAETGPKAAQLASFKARLLDETVVNFFRSPEDLRAYIHQSLMHYKERHPTLEYRISSGESAHFSPAIRDEMKRLSKVIDRLTQEQFKVIDFLSGHKRVAITGGAGSGKTLVATEKAIRLARAGLRTLMMCHNPHLASHIRRMAAGTGVEVMDFAEWIAHLVGKPLDSDDRWSHYAEPSEGELEDAFDLLVDADQRYDAIVVDEAQDFRDEWWLLVEAALNNAKHDILYIFHDNNQALLPHRSRYPVVQSPIVLTQNCRNAGEVFDVVTAFHRRLRQSPPPELLQRTGTYRKWVFEEGRPIEAVSEAIREALTVLNPSQLVVLTLGPTDATPLEDLEVPLEFSWRWQERVAHYFEFLTKEFRYGATLPPLSDALRPTPRDIETVTGFATRIFRTITGYEMGVSTRPKWVVGGRRGLRLLPNRMTPHQRLHFFTTPDWADTLPVPPRIRLVPVDRYQGGDEALKLASVSSFKGLEADGVVLCVMRPTDQMRANLYVGASRARFLLHLVIDPRSNVQLPRTEDRGS